MSGVIGRAGLDVGALISSRICHDLISPVGAIANGVELLTETSGGAPTPELDLIGDSVNQAARKLRLFRIAFGAVPPGSEVSLNDLRAAIAALDGGRSSVAVQASGTSVPRISAKLLTLLLLCQERALPVGGQTEAEISDDEIAVLCKTDRTRDLGPLWGYVEDPSRAAEVAAADIQFVLLGLALRDVGSRLVQEPGDGMRHRIPIPIGLLMADQASGF